jgi:predicted unusual protein kinase regulating ubiquinone biosynthesis (AarF/ABC1/UbiB family)
MQTNHQTAVHAGNLLVLPDGRVAFIDFGIAGKISAATWGGLEALLVAVSTQDYDMMVRGSRWREVLGHG